ncbi:thiol-activated cytolysin family protein [Pedobacter gandavensis]|uniref:thiol-activated cytolysin family protein n=1 Tax=Pedobacter gandavensis TaxID=2679963 RepID=UPI00292CBA6E|nr:thiol-activated cytolysin family protein [Pedobacter gandavensis]
MNVSKKNSYKLPAVIAGLMMISGLNSCTKDHSLDTVVQEEKAPKGYISQFKGAKRAANPFIEVTVSDAKVLDNLLQSRKQNTVEILRDSVWTGGKTLFLRSTDIPAINPEIRKSIYLGAIIKGEVITDVSAIKPLLLPSSERNPITMYATFITDSTSREVAKPSPEADRSYLRDALKAGSGKQLSAFRFNMESFSRTNELRLSFGANVNIGGILGITTTETSLFSAKKTSVRVEFTQENYSINIEPPLGLPFIKNMTDKTKFGLLDPMIVSSITYGRKGIMTFESDSNYEEVVKTLNIILKLPIPKLVSEGGKPLISAEIGLSKEQMSLLENSIMKVYVIGVNGKDVFKIVKGLEGFMEILATGQEFSPETPGVPLFYTLHYVSDFSNYWNNFKVNIAN